MVLKRRFGKFGIVDVMGNVMGFHIVGHACMHLRQKGIQAFRVMQVTPFAIPFPQSFFRQDQGYGPLCLDQLLAMGARNLFDFVCLQYDRCQQTIVLMFYVLIPVT